MREPPSGPSKDRRGRINMRHAEATPPVAKGTTRRRQREWDGACLAASRSGAGRRRWDTARPHPGHSLRRGSAVRGRWSWRPIRPSPVSAGEKMVDLNQVVPHDACPTDSSTLTTRILLALRRHNCPLSANGQSRSMRPRPLNETERWNSFISPISGNGTRWLADG